MEVVRDISIKTPADELMELVRVKKKISMDAAARELRLPLATVQALVDFLVEEKVLGVEYKFTTPYIYINDASQVKLKNMGKADGGASLAKKEAFYKKAEGKGIPKIKIDSLWRKYLGAHIPELRQEFVHKALERGLSRDKAEDLWLKYLNYLY